MALSRTALNQRGCSVAIEVSDIPNSRHAKASNAFSLFCFEAIVRFRKAHMAFLASGFFVAFVVDVQLFDVI